MLFPGLQIPAPMLWWACSFDACSLILLGHMGPAYVHNLHSFISSVT